MDDGPRSSVNIRLQLLLLVLRMSRRCAAATREVRLEDGLGLSCTLAKQSVTLEVVLLCRGRCM
jgi:hypothetical protein